jgi:hypothetical protein
MARDDLGFAGLLMVGTSPAEAWDRIRATAADPEVQALIAALQDTEQGRAALDWSRQQWAAHQLPPPWDLGAD